MNFISIGGNMDNAFWVFIGLAIGIIMSKTLNFIAANVEFKKGFIDGYKKGMQEAVMSNMKIQHRFDPFKSLLTTNIIYVPDSPDIDTHIMNEHRSKELLEMQRIV